MCGAVFAVGLASEIRGKKETAQLANVTYASASNNNKRGQRVSQTVNTCESNDKQRKVERKIQEGKTGALTACVQQHKCRSNNQKKKQTPATGEPLLPACQSRPLRAGVEDATDVNKQRAGTRRAH